MQDLKKELKARDLPVSGNKSELLERLEEALKTEEGRSIISVYLQPFTFNLHNSTYGPRLNF